MKILVTGAKGQLGTDLGAELKKRNHEAVLADIEDFDICDEKATSDFITAAAPDAVIHCAAWTAVDAAEEIENVDRVYEINCSGTMNVAKACGRLGCKMLYLSTDYVFGDNRQNGFKQLIESESRSAGVVAPYDDSSDESELRKLYEDAEKDLMISPDCGDFEPQGVYAKSKLMGETAVKEFVEKYFIVRISWVFGLNGKNFVKTMLNLAKTHDMLSVVDDQVGRPTYTPDLARLLVDMVESDKYGFYHATNEGENISWADYAREIFRLADLNIKVTGISTAEYGAPAKRPLNSRLDTSKLRKCGFKPLPDWKDALERYLRTVNE